MIDYKILGIEDKTEYEKAQEDGFERGCESSFSNLFMWGEQRIARLGEQISVLSRYGSKKLYPFPLGGTDKTETIRRIIDDSKQRGIDCLISGLTDRAKEYLEENFGGLFTYSTNEGSYDYVYTVKDLSDLAGRKYQSKRNHVSRFDREHPNAAVLPIKEEHLPLVREMAEIWYSERSTPEEDFSFERAALTRALDNYIALGLTGLLIIEDERVIAFTVASRMGRDTLDVHFEKALPGIDGAYAKINNEFAKYVREKYPDITYLDREEDMGIEGLRKAKLSYHPHHRVVKYKAHLIKEKL